MTKKLKYIHQGFCWINYWIEIICLIIGILTLGFYRPWWDFTFMIWESKKLVQKQMDKKKL